MGFSAVSYVKSVDNISDLATKAVDAHTVMERVPALTGHDLRLITKLIAGLEAAPKMTANVMKLDLETLCAIIAKYRRGYRTAYCKVQAVHTSQLGRVTCNALHSTVPWNFYST